MDSFQSDLNNIWILLCAGLILLQQAGFLCVEAGVTRKKNSINVSLKNIVDLGLGLVIFFALAQPLIQLLEGNLFSQESAPQQSLALLTATPTSFDLVTK